MRRMKRLQELVNRIPIRWRLTLVSLGLLALLLGALGGIILFTAEQALLSNTATALHNEAHLLTRNMKDHSFELALPPGPPPGTLSPSLQTSVMILAQRLASPSTNATILSPQGDVIVSNNDFPFAPPPVMLSSTRIQRALNSGQDSNSYLLGNDTQNNRQLIVLIPLVSSHQTVAILQLSKPTASIDNFITTLRLILLLGVIGALGLATALTFPLVTAALRPLVDMERTSHRIAEGALSMRIDTPVTNDEIGHLALSFNRMVAQLETAFKRQKQFVADVSHELRTPLTALSGSLEMLLMGADRGDTEATRRLARGMYAEVQRMHRLVEDLLALTRLDEGKIILRKDTINVRTVIDKVYDQAQQLAHGQEIQSKVASDTPPVYADSDRLQQVLLNIVDNALKFTPSDGRVELSARGEKQATVIIEVHDTGKGISPETLPHVFDRFYRADPSRSRFPQQAGGNGLGLAIAKELIEAQGGTITISSTLCEGTTVTIRLCAVLSEPEHATW